MFLDFNQSIRVTSNGSSVRRELFFLVVEAFVICDVMLLNNVLRNTYSCKRTFAGPLIVSIFNWHYLDKENMLNKCNLSRYLVLLFLTNTW